MNKQVAMLWPYKFYFWTLFSHVFSKFIRFVSFPKRYIYFDSLPLLVFQGQWSPLLLVNEPYFSFFQNYSFKEVLCSLTSHFIHLLERLQCTWRLGFWVLWKFYVCTYIVKFYLEIMTIPFANSICVVSAVRGMGPLSLVDCHYWIVLSWSVNQTALILYEWMLHI